MAKPECCTKPENLELQPSDKPELEIRKCRECGRCHFELTLDPGSLGLVDPQAEKKAE